jgi:hypothetical protein
MPTQRRYGPEFPLARQLDNQLEAARAKLDAIRDVVSGHDGVLAEEVRAILGEPWKPVEVDQALLDERRKEWKL